MNKIFPLHQNLAATPIGIFDEESSQACSGLFYKNSLSRPIANPTYILPDQSLYAKINKIEKSIQEIKAMLAQNLDHNSLKETIRTVSLKTAKSEIAKYFLANDGKTIDYGDLIDELHLPLPQIVKACSFLEKEGKIAGVD